MLPPSSAVCLCAALARHRKLTRRRHSQCVLGAQRKTSLREVRGTVATTSTNHSLPETVAASTLSCSGPACTAERALLVLVTCHCTCYALWLKCCQLLPSPCNTESSFHNSLLLLLVGGVSRGLVKPRNAATTVITWPAGRLLREYLPPMLCCLAAGACVAVFMSTWKGTNGVSSVNS